LEVAYFLGHPVEHIQLLTICSTFATQDIDMRLYSAVNCTCKRALFQQICTRILVTTRYSI